MKHRSFFTLCQSSVAISMASAWLLFAPGTSTWADSFPAPGLPEFTGRLSHNHWHLFGPGTRGELDELNRNVRTLEQQMRSAKSATERDSAQAQGRRAMDALLGMVRGNPRLLRVNLGAEAPGFEVAQPVTQPGDSGALLMEIRSMGEGLHFVTGWGDLSQPPGESTLVSLELPASGLTYVLLGLEHLPVGMTTLLVELRRPGHPNLRLPLDVTTPEPGQLQVTVLSDETGEPVPAMVRLMWRTDGMQRRPGNGIDFAPQFDGQGHASGVRAANLPGALGTHFWCSPGPFNMAVPPGVWQIGIRRGVEHEVVFQDVTVASGKLTTETFRPRRWVNMSHLGWWSGDDHVHGHILSDEDAANLMAWIKAEDVHLANVVKMGDIYRTYFEQRGFGPDHRVQEGTYVLSPGQECPRTHDQIGHTLAMNITSMVRDPARYFLYDTIFDEVHAQGGLSGYAHVNSGLFHVHRDMSLNVPPGRVDFVELIQFNHLGTDLYYDFLNLGCKLTASAGSDVPWGGSVGEVRAYAYLGDQPFSADAWFEAFRRGRTFTTSGPMIELHVEDALPGDELLVQEDRSLRVKARAWGDPGRMTPVTLEVVRHGEVLRRAVSAPQGPTEATLEFDVEAGHGSWIAARARGGEGTSAHTTPVYVVREGFRFWKFDELESQFEKRLASLGEIERIVEEARRLEAAGQLGADRYRSLLAAQGPALLERVQAARSTYEGLREVALAEADARKRPKPSAR